MPFENFMDPGKSPMDPLHPAEMSEGLETSPSLFDIGENMGFLETHVQVRHPIASRKQRSLMRFIEEE